MAKYTVVWSTNGEASYVDYIECSPELSTQDMVAEAVLQNISDWEEILEEYGNNVEKMLDDGYYLYAIFEGYPRVIY